MSGGVFNKIVSIIEKVDNDSDNSGIASTQQGNKNRQQTQNGNDKKNSNNEGGYAISIDGGREGEQRQQHTNAVSRGEEDVEEEGEDNRSLPLDLGSPVAKSNAGQSADNSPSASSHRLYVGTHDSNEEDANGNGNVRTGMKKEENGGDTANNSKNKRWNQQIAELEARCASQQHELRRLTETNEALGAKLTQQGGLFEALLSRFNAIQADRRGGANVTAAPDDNHHLSSLSPAAASSSGRAAAATTSTTTRDELEETWEYELRNQVENERARPTEELQRLISYHTETIAALEQSNRKLRAQILADEANYEQDLGKVRDEAASASVDYQKFVDTLKENDKRKQDTARLSKKITALRDVCLQSERKEVALNEQVEMLTRLVAQRDDTIAELTNTVSATRELRAMPIYQTLERKGWAGRAVTQGATYLDVISMHAGRFLRANAMLRICIVGYLILLHVYVFHVVGSSVHVLKPHHVMGHDVHDHLEHHVHH